MQNTSRIKTLITLLFSVMIISACKSTSSTVDYDTDTNFNQFKQYQMVASKQPTNKKQPPTDQMTADRISAAIESQLNAKALTKVDAAAELQVSYFTATEQKENTSSLGISIGGAKIGGNTSTGVGVGTSVPISSDVSTITQITIDIYHQDKLIWRGIDSYETDSDVTPQEREKEINTTVANIMANYPPKK